MKNRIVWWRVSYNSFWYSYQTYINETIIFAFCLSCQISKPICLKHHHYDYFKLWFQNLRVQHFISHTLQTYSIAWPTPLHSRVVCVRICHPATHTTRGSLPEHPLWWCDRCPVTLSVMHYRLLLRSGVVADDWGRCWGIFWGSVDTYIVFVIEEVFWEMFCCWELVLFVKVVWVE